MFIIYQEIPNLKIFCKFIKRNYYIYTYELFSWWLFSANRNSKIQVKCYQNIFTENNKIKSKNITRYHSNILNNGAIKLLSSSFRKSGKILSLSKHIVPKPWSYSCRICIFTPILNMLYTLYACIFTCIKLVRYIQYIDWMMNESDRIFFKHQRKLRQMDSNYWIFWNNFKLI